MVRSHAGAYNKRCAHAGTHNSGTYAGANNKRCANAGAHDSGTHAGADARSNAGTHREIMSACNRIKPAL